MIKVLIVEDSVPKAEAVRSLVVGFEEISEDDVVVANDLVEARDICRRTMFDLLILDLQLPTRAGDDPRDGAGCDFVMELVQSVTLFKPYHIIGLTAYDEVYSGSEVIFDTELWKIIKYVEGENLWRSQLAGKIQYLLGSRKSLTQMEMPSYECDVCIIAALRKPELQAVLDLPGEWKQLEIPGDAAVCYTGEFANGAKRVRVVAASAPQMGLTATSALATKMIMQHKPRYLAMVGIAAGVKGAGPQLGDILVADSSWNYESGKRKSVDGVAVFDPDPKFLGLDFGLKSQVLEAQASRSYLETIQGGWRGRSPDTRLGVHVGPVGSGGSVVQDTAVIEGIKRGQRKLIGIDMETYAVFYAAENSPVPKPIAVSMKSVCDFADEDKSDDFQEYAAYTSAQYLYNFALDRFSR